MVREKYFMKMEIILLDNLNKDKKMAQGLFLKKKSLELKAEKKINLKSLGKKININDFMIITIILIRHEIRCFIYNQSFPFRDTNMVLLLFELIMFCNAYRYLICIAD